MKCGVKVIKICKAEFIPIFILYPFFSLLNHPTFMLSCYMYTKLNLILI